MDNYHFTKSCFIGKREWSTILFLALVTLVIAIMTWLLPMIGDDYFYLYVSTGEGFDYDRPVQNLKDLLESQYDHFLYVNGRAFVHFLYQFIDTLIGKWLFNLLNPLFFLGYDGGTHHDNANLFCILSVDGREHELLMDNGYRSCFFDSV